MPSFDRGESRRRQPTDNHAALSSARGHSEAAAERGHTGTAHPAGGGTAGKDVFGQPGASGRVVTCKGDLCRGRVKTTLQILGPFFHI